MNASSWNVAIRKGAWAAAPQNRRLERFSQRELLEVALHLAALTTGEADTALGDGRAAERIEEEVRALRRAGLI